jgi:hypothetical protein
MKYKRGNLIRTYFGSTGVVVKVEKRANSTLINYGTDDRNYCFVHWSNGLASWYVHENLAKIDERAVRSFRVGPLRPATVRGNK